MFWAGGFFYNPERREVLLHKRDGNTKINPHMWAFFGGGSEGDETPIETFIREIGEELGVNLTSNQPVALCDYEGGLLTHRYVFYVISDLSKDQMTLGEGADFDWVPLERVFEYELTEKSVRDLHTFIREVIQ